MSEAKVVTRRMYGNIWEHTSPADMVDETDDRDLLTDPHFDNFGRSLGPEELIDLECLSGLLYQHGGTKIRKFAVERTLESNGSHIWAEFGCERGHSADFFMNYLPKDGLMFLFDSFEGLPEDWALSYKNIRPKEAWACSIPVFKDERAIIVEGWFEDTLPMASNVGPLGFIHIDSDLYVSCKTIFDKCDSQIMTGTIILFDELWGYPNWADGEYKALMEWHRAWKYLARDTKGRTVIEVCD